MAAELERRYMGGMPIRVPEGLVVVHNHVRPAHAINTSGFRVWVQKLTENLVPCACGWAPHLSGHYRVNLEKN
jgi:hypothetical protein